MDTTSSSKLNFPDNLDETTDPLKNTTAKALKDMLKDRSMAKYQTVLNQVYSFVIQAIDNDKKWHMKCQTLRSELVARDSKVKAALQLAKEDKQTIDMLRSELDRTWNLTNPPNENNPASNSAKERKLANENKNLAEQLSFCEQEIIVMKSEESRLNAEKEKMEKELDKQIKTNSKNKLEMAKYHKDLKSLKEELSKSNSESESNKGIIKEMELKIQKLEENCQKQLKMKKSEQRNSITENENQRVEILELQKLLNESQNCTTLMLEEKKCMSQINAEKETEIENLKREMNNMKGNRKTMVDKSVNTINNEDVSIRSNEKMKKAAEQISFAENKRTFDLKLQKAEKTLSEQWKLLQSKDKEIHSKNLESSRIRNECIHLKDEMLKQALTITELNKLKDKYARDLVHMESELQNLGPEILQKEESKSLAQIEDLEEQLRNTKSQLKEKENVSRSYLSNLEEAYSKSEQLNTINIATEMELQNIIDNLQLWIENYSHLCKTGYNDSSAIGDGYISEIPANLNTEEGLGVSMKQLKLKLQTIKNLLDVAVTYKNEVEDYANHAEQTRSNTYSEPADILVNDIHNEKQKCDSQNIINSHSLSSNNYSNLENFLNASDNKQRDFEQNLNFENAELMCERTNKSQTDGDKLSLPYTTENNLESLNLTSTSPIKSPVTETPSQSHISKFEREQFFQKIMMLEQMLETKTEENIEKNISLEDKEKAIENLKIIISEYEKENDIIKCRAELNEKQKQLEQMGEKLKSFELQNVTTDTIPQMSPRNPNQRFGKRLPAPISVNRLILPEPDKSWPAKSTKFYMKSEFNSKLQKK